MNDSRAGRSADLLPGSVGYPQSDPGVSFLDAWRANRPKDNPREMWLADGWNFLEDVIYSLDGSLGLSFKDGQAGRIGIGTTDVETWDVSIHGVIEGEKEAITFGDTAGGPRVQIWANMYYASSPNESKAKATGASSVFSVDDTFIAFGTAASVAADVATNVVNDFEIVGDGGTSTGMNLGGGAEAPDRDVTILLATDEKLVWDESEDVFGSSGRFGFVPATTAVAANATFVALATHAASASFYELKRVSSSLRYKDQVKYEVPTWALYASRPITFKSKCLGDPEDDFYGLAAEDVALLGVPCLVTYATIDGRSVPDSVNYVAYVPLLIKEIQNLKAEIDALKGAA